MLDLGVALGVWGAIIIVISILGKLLGRPLIDGVAIGIFVAFISLMLFLHPFQVVDGVYVSQYGDSIVAIILAVSLLLCGCFLVYFFIRMGRCRCWCCKDEELFDERVVFNDLYTDNLV